MSFNGQLLATGGVAQCLTDSVQVFGADGTYSSNKLLYQFENNVTNTVGSPTATNSGATFSSSTVKLGSYSAEFAGTTQHIDTGYSENDTSLTHSFWMYQQSISGSYNGILGNYWNGGAAVYGYYLWCDDPGTALNWRVHTSNAANVQVTGTISLNAWHHVVITWSDGVGASIYIDGVLAQFTASSLSRQQNSLELTLGNIDNRGSSTIGYDGFLDQYRYYNRAVSASEAQTLYAETNATTSNTNLFNEGAGLALYTLDYDGSDAGGLYDGTPTNVEFGVGGQINYGARFNGSSSKISLPNGSFQNTILSVSAWINVSNTSSTRTIIETYGYSGSSKGWLFRLISGKLQFDGYNGDPASTVLTSNESIPLNTWTHVAVVFSANTKGELYINGSEVTYATQTVGTVGYISNEAVNIGTLQGTGVAAQDYFIGSIDQVRIFSKALNQSEIDTLYAETACVYTCTTDTVNYPTTNVAYYKLDNSADDETGVYDGTSTDVNYAFGRFNQAAVFNGSSSIINDVLSGFTYDNKNITFSAWIKSSKTTQGNNVIIGQAISNADGGWGIATGYAAAQKLSFSIAKPGVQSVIGSVTMNTGNWQHIVVIVDFADIGSGGTSAVKMYVDGVEDTGLTGNLTQNFDESSYNTSIGGTFAGSNSRFFDGDIDQVRIFSSALSDSQITELYNEKPCADTSTFKTVLYDGTSAEQYISNVGFQPDLVWMKSRNNNYNNTLYDSVRGTGTSKAIYSNEAVAENAFPTINNFVSFDANGFTVGATSATNNIINKTGDNLVAWNWKAGGDAVSGTGTGVSNVSVSANTDAGFSIVKYTGGNGASDTVNHGLTDAEMIFLKDLDDGTNQWRAWHKDLTANHWMYLNLSNAQTSAATDGGIRNVDANTFGFINGTTGGVEAVNSSASDYIAYVWKSVAGYSKIGSYTGATSGVTENIGFEPSMVIIKNATQSDPWGIFDNKRPSGTGNRSYLYPSTSDDEDVYSGSLSGLTLTSTGFAIDNTNSHMVNQNGETYIYMALK